MRALAAPLIVVEITKSVEASLQFFRSVALLYGDALTRNVAAPLEVRARIIGPGRTSQAAAKALVGLCLDDRDAGVNFARSAFSLDVATAIVATEFETKSAIRSDADRLGGGSSRGERENARKYNGFGKAHVENPD